MSLHQAVHKAVRDAADHNQSMQEEVRSKRSRAVDDACGKTASEVGVRPEYVHGSGEAKAQMGSPARLVNATEEDC